MTDTLFDRIVKKEIPAWIIWEDDKFMAFLTPFPNTPGMSVVIPKLNHGDYIFSLDRSIAKDLLDAAYSVSKILEKALKVKRVAMVVEGTGVPYVHIKLYPLHGNLGAQTDVWTKHQEFYPEYIGYLTTVEGPRMSDDELTKIQQRILEAAKE